MFILLTHHSLGVGVGVGVGIGAGEGLPARRERTLARVGERGLAGGWGVALVGGEDARVGVGDARAAGGDARVGGGDARFGGWGAEVCF